MKKNSSASRSGPLPAVFSLADLDEEAIKQELARRADARKRQNELEDMAAKVARLEQLVASMTTAPVTTPAPVRRPAAPPARPAKRPRPSRSKPRPEPVFFQSKAASAASEDYDGTALADIRALVAKLGAVRVADVVAAGIRNHKGNIIHETNVRRFMRKLVARNELVEGEELCPHIPGPGARRVWAKDYATLELVRKGKLPTPADAQYTRTFSGPKA